MRSARVQNIAALRSNPSYTTLHATIGSSLKEFHFTCSAHFLTLSIVSLADDVAGQYAFDALTNTCAEVRRCLGSRARFDCSFAASLLKFTKIFSSARHDVTFLARSIMNGPHPHLSRSAFHVCVEVSPKCSSRLEFSTKDLVKDPLPSAGLTLAVHPGYATSMYCMQLVPPKMQSKAQKIMETSLDPIRRCSDLNDAFHTVNLQGPEVRVSLSH
eukprot:4968390-Amphidinium_carterae.1